MREISIDEIQERQLALLDHVAAFCDEHHLTYILIGGALLGSVRNGKLIPWDDDIDLFMPRADYRKFIEIFSDTGKCQLLTSEREPNYYYPFAKVCDRETTFIENAKEQGLKSLDCLKVGIDIFPVDYLPKNPFEREIKILQQRLLQGLCYRDFRLLDSHSIPLVFRMILTVYKAIKKLNANTVNDYIAAMDELWGNQAEGAILFDSWTYKRHNALAIVPTGYATLEGKRYSAPNDLDYFLTECYGKTYMTPRVDMPDGHGKAYVL